MFGIKKKNSNDIPSVQTASDNIQKCPEPYEDEPSFWSQLPPEQLLSIWYHLACNVKSDPQMNEIDPLLWYIEAAHAGDPAAQYTLGKHYYKENNVFQAGIWYTQASELQCPFADYELAKMCEYGIGMVADKDAAKEYYQRAYDSFSLKVSSAPNKAIALKLYVMCKHKLATGSPEDTARWQSQIKAPEYIHEKAKEEKLISLDTLPSTVNESQPDQILQVNFAQHEDIEPDNRSNSLSENVPVEYITPSKDNPYAENDKEEDIYELAMSIQANGLINPITLNKVSNTQYIIISGERRYKAITQYLHWPKIPATVYNNLSPNAAQLILHTANLEVREYTASQKLDYYIKTEALLQSMKNSGEYSGSIQKGISEALGVSTHQIRKYKKIIESPDKTLLSEVMNGTISVEKAYKLATIKADAQKSTGDGRTSDLQEQPEERRTSALQEQPEDGRTSALQEQPEEGRTSALQEQPEAGRTSAFQEQPEDGRTSAFQEQPEDGRTSALQEQPEDRRTSAFRDPLNYKDAVSLLYTLPFAPGNICAVIERGRVNSGVIDHIELYESKLELSVIVKEIQRSFSISMIGKSIFIGEDCMVAAENAVKCL